MNLFTIFLLPKAHHVFLIQTNSLHSSLALNHRTGPFEAIIFPSLKVLHEVLRRAAGRGRDSPARAAQLRALGGRNLALAEARPGGRRAARLVQERPLQRAVLRHRRRQRLAQDGHRGGQAAAR